VFSLTQRKNFSLCVLTSLILPTFFSRLLIKNIVYEVTTQRKGIIVLKYVESFKTCFPFIYHLYFLSNSSLISELYVYRRL
jgi:ABC-type polysaccharide transport system permease subunit